MIAPVVLGFAAVGLWLIYLAYRYNLLFVLNTTNIDTKGLVYPRALQQTTTGIYLALVCIIGLFAVAKAWGPLILMILYLVIAVVFHMSLNAAMDPLLKFLPKSLQVEEEPLLALENGQRTAINSQDDSNTIQPDSKTTYISSQERNNSTLSTAQSPSNRPLTSPHHQHFKTPNILTTFLHPHTHSSYLNDHHQRISRSFPETSYPEEVARGAYFDPAISSPTPVLWIPRDGMGISTQEIRHTMDTCGVVMTDEGAGFDEKGKIFWDKGNEPPAAVWNEKRIY